MSDLLEFFERRSTLFTALAAIFTILVGVVTFFIQMRRKKHEYAEKIEDLETKLHDKTGLVAGLEERLNQAKKEYDEIEMEKRRLDETREEDRRNHELITAGLTEELVGHKVAVSGREKEIRQHENLIKRMMKLEGELWEKPARRGIPKFLPLLERRMPILSVLNLKGGVGKTTVTAYLANAFAAKGYRVLMIDLDLQGSLSALFLTYSDIARTFKEEHLLQHFLNEATSTRPNLLDYKVPVFEDGQSSIIPTSDKLAYAEMNLTMSWLLRLIKKDTRFLLRRALHQKRISKKYDIVLLDCPPLINTCCVNALAASDYVLIPVNPSKSTTERVPLVLSQVKKLSVRINPHLNVAGIVMNRSYRDDRMTANEAELWEQALTWGTDQLGVPLHGFKTLIPNTVEIRDYEAGDFKGPKPGSDLHKVFRKLAAELEARLPVDSRRPAASNT